jgi:cytochrome P450
VSATLVDSKFVSNHGQRVLIFGAQDSTSAALSRILWQLSLRPDIQERVRDENLELYDKQGISGQDNARLSYEELMGMPWLDAVVKETLRL